VASFIVFRCIAIPLGQAIHFIQFDPQWSQLKSLPFVSLGILFFTLGPRSFSSAPPPKSAFAREQERSCGWWTASILFASRTSPTWASQLALRNPGLHRRFFLRLDLAQDRLDFRFRTAPRAVDIAWHFLFRTV